MPKLKIDEINKLLIDAEAADNELFAEQRSNILLIAGDHYARRSARFLNKLRENYEIPNEQKLRITKNHTQKIYKSYVNNIVTYAPGVTVMPANENELQDQKSAELNLAVWQDIKRRHRLKAKTREQASDFCGIGEVACKVFWDPMAGKLKGYEAQVDEAGQPVLDEQGQMIPSETAVFSGDFVFERILGPNLLRPAGCKDLSKAEWLGIRKMESTSLLKKMVQGDDKKLKMIEETEDDTYVVFEAQRATYDKVKGQTLVREMYYRPCPEYPMGYFYISTPKGILFEGELPYGKFPIIYAGFDENPTSPRARSIIKQLRPYQAEINRAGSKIAEHQVTVGDDKMIIPSGATIEGGKVVAGVRTYKVNGTAPTFLPGRDGSQFLGYMESQIKEMYEVANVYEDAVEKDGQLDPYALLFRSLRNKKRFSLYAEKFEQFLIDLAELTLELARHYLPDDALIAAVGRREWINIAEFKNSDPMANQIKLEPQTEDIESKMGKQLVMNHALQYVGAKLDKEDLGKIMRNMPYANLDESFNDLTLDYENATNDILALDRGELPQINKYDKHDYIIKRLTARMRQADYRFLSPQIQGNYEQVLAQHEQMQTEQLKALQEAQNGFIPTGGYLVGVDFYVNDANKPGVTKRARLPYEAIQDLIQKLERQGTTLDQLETMNRGAMEDMAHMLVSGNPPTMPAQDRAGMPPMGQASPQGMRNDPRFANVSQLR